MMANLKYFRVALVVTAIGVALSGVVGGMYSDWSPKGIAEFAFIALILGVLEVSLSFDNSVVAATILRDMDPVWRKRYLTWGMLIGVGGMRLIFPLLIVAIVAHISPWAALKLAATDPAGYGAIVTSAHHSIGAFGGTFLLLVGLNFFLDPEKDVHWLHVVEHPVSRLGRMDSVSIAIALVAVVVLSRLVDDAHSGSVLFSGVLGVVTFVAVQGLSGLMGEPGHAVAGQAARGGAASFLYLETIDASFSFDGVIGAFALTNILFIIVIGLGIGAIFVRSMTIMLVEKGTLAEFRYLEHGAFTAILTLAAIMYANLVVHIPEVVTGCLGAAIIGLAVWASIRHNRAEAKAATDAVATSPAE